MAAVSIVAQVYSSAEERDAIARRFTAEGYKVISAVGGVIIGEKRARWSRERIAATKKY